MRVTFAAQSTPRNDPFACLARSNLVEGDAKKSGPESVRGRFLVKKVRITP
jgi:hypothetical protein